mmetsp:Transcript_58810/g.108626  ORF Transcript_58810/g.108626 Transcript_58810/m.108626 type:complete len:290 (-) Transcript_58810:199-1068(-)
MLVKGIDTSVATKSVDALSCASTTSGTSSIESPGLDVVQHPVANEDADALRSESRMVQWTVHLHRKKGRIGMQVTETMQGTRAVILGVHAGGQIACWNARHQDKQLRAGDLIMQVNDVTSGARALTEEIMRETATLTLRLGRYVSFPVHIPSRPRGDRLGIVEDSLTVIEVVQGSVVDLHRTKDMAPPEFWLRPGDRIVACNGYESEREIRSDLQEAEQIEMLVHRPIPRTATETKEDSFISGRGQKGPSMERAKDGARSLMKYVGCKLGAQKMHKQKGVVQDALLDDF